MGYWHGRLPALLVQPSCQFLSLVILVQDPVPFEQFLLPFDFTDVAPVLIFSLQLLVFEEGLLAGVLLLFVHNIFVLLGKLALLKFLQFLLQLYFGA